jgi:hypothetical protein
MDVVALFMAKTLLMLVAAEHVTIVVLQSIKKINVMFAQ